MDRQQIMQLASQNPEIQQGVELAKQQVAHMDLNPQMINEIIQVLEHVLDNPQDYAAIRAAAIRDGFIEESDLPAEFDPVVVASLLIVFYGVRDHAGVQQEQKAAFARGGLARLAAQGRGGDTMLAHVNPMEAEMLRRMGGSGTVNPHTGIREFKGGGLTSVVKAVAPIALNFVVPGMGTAMSAAIGAGIGALGGGGLKGAALGALGGALGAGGGGALGSAISDATGLGLNPVTSDILGNSLIGGVVGKATGQGFKQGATMGALGGMASNAIGGMAGTDSSALNSGLRAGGTTTGSLLTLGASPSMALKGGALAGLVSGGYQGYQNYQNAAKPSATVTNKLGLKAGQDAMGDLYRPADARTNYGEWDYSTSDPYGIKAPSDVYTITEPNANPRLGPGMETSATANDLYKSPESLMQKLGADTTNLGLNKATASGALALSTLASAAKQEPPPEAQKGIQSLSPAQQEYFNRPSYVWDWETMQQDANAAGQDLGTYMAKNWDTVSSGKYNKELPSGQTKGAQNYARGGALNALAQGGGSGRADTIHAKLSDGEYVMDAETVALLGDGSTKEGARRLDEMRKKLRMQKGKTLARGGFSPAAKSPLAYLKGAA